MSRQWVCASPRALQHLPTLPGPSPAPLAGLALARLCTAALAQVGAAQIGAGARGCRARQRQSALGRWRLMARNGLGSQRGKKRLAGHILVHCQLLQRWEVLAVVQPAACDLLLGPTRILQQRLEHAGGTRCQPYRQHLEQVEGAAVRCGTRGGPAAHKHSMHACTCMDWCAPHRHSCIRCHERCIAESCTQQHREQAPVGQVARQALAAGRYVQQARGKRQLWLAATLQRGQGEEGWSLSAARRELRVSCKAAQSSPCAPQTQLAWSSPAAASIASSRAGRRAAGLRI